MFLIENFGSMCQSYFLKFFLYYDAWILLLEFCTLIVCIIVYFTAFDLLSSLEKKYARSSQ